MPDYDDALVAWFTAEEAKARQAGRTGDVDALNAALTAYRDSGRLPLIVPDKLNQRAWTAQQKFEAALIKGAGDYTKKKLDAEVEEVKEKLEAFRQRTDRLPKGSEWKGAMTFVDRTRKGKLFQDQAEVTVVGKTLDTVTFRAALKEQHQWEYEFESTVRGYVLMRAELMVVQNNFGDKLGNYPAEGTLVFQGRNLILKVSRGTGTDVRDVYYELAPVE